MACGVLASVVGLWSITVPSLWRDESVTAHFARLPLSQAWDEWQQFDAVHALHYLISRTTSWVEPVELGLRLPSVAGFVAATIGIVLVGHRLSGWAAGACSGAVYALLPISSHFAQEARSYALVSATAVFASLALLRLVDRPTRGRTAVYGILLVLLGYLHLYALLVVVAHAAHVAVSARTVAKQAVAAWVLAAAAVLPLAVVAAGQRERQLFWIRRPGRSEVVDLLQEMGGTRSLSLLLALAVLAGAWFLRRSPLPLCWFVLPVAVSLAVSQVHPIFQTRYVLYVVPALALLAGAGIDGVGRRLGRGRGAFVVLALALVAVLGLPEQRAVRGADSRSDDLRTMTSDLGVAVRPGDALVLQPAEFGAFVDAYRGPFDRLEQVEPEAVASDVVRVWVLNRDHPDERRYPRLARLGRDFDRVQVRSYGVVTLSLWTRDVRARSG